VDLLNITEAAWKGGCNALFPNLLIDSLENLVYLHSGKNQSKEIVKKATSVALDSLMFYISPSVSAIKAAYIGKAIKQIPTEGNESKKTKDFSSRVALTILVEMVIFASLGREKATEALVYSFFAGVATGAVCCIAENMQK
jgi:hypothetical protein